MGIEAVGANAVVYPPGQEGFLHFHDVQDELYFVHAGTARFEVDGEVRLWIETSGSWEGPYSALALIAFLLLLLAFREQSYRGRRLALSTGLIAGVVALLAPSLLTAVAFMLLAELATQRGRRLAVLRLWVVVAVVGCAVVTPWAVRNHLVMHAFVPLRTTFGLELAIGNNDAVDGRTLRAAWDAPDGLLGARHPFTSLPERQRLAGMGELAYMRERQREALEWIASNPARFVRLCGARFLLFWFPPAELWPLSSPGRRLKSVVFTSIGAGAFLALLVMAIRRHSASALMLALLLGGCFACVVTRVDMRYRYPVSGLSALLSCHLVAVVAAPFWPRGAWANPWRAIGRVARP